MNDTQSLNTELVKSISIENLLAQREGAIRRFRSAIDLIKEAREIAKNAQMSAPDLDIRLTGGQDYRMFSGIADDLTMFTREMDRGGWRYLMKESGMRTFMDTKARAEWDNKLYSGEVPELTRANIAATFDNLFKSRTELFERGIVNVFRSLSWNYKSNLPVKFGKKIIINNLVDVTPHWISFKHSSGNQLDDVERVFHILGGKPEPDHRNGWHDRLQSNTAQNKAESDYCALTWFKKGTGHVVFKRPELVDQMNAIIAKHHPDALPAAV